METRYIDVYDRLVFLGKSGENRARKIIFNISRWVSVYKEGGTVALIVKRSGDAVSYPALISFDGENVEWVLEAADVEKPGKGVCELQYLIDGTVVKSKTFETLVDESVGGLEGEIPEPQKAWTDAVVQAGTEALKGAEEAKSAAKEAEGYAEEAESAAEEAENHANTAGAAAKEAESYANTVGGAAKEAHGYAGEAKSAAKNAESYAGEAKSAAKEAENHAGEAGSAAKDAEGYAGAAEIAMGRYPYIDKGTETWWVWDAQAGKFTDTKIKATGEIETDTTLTESGKAADAKAVGDALQATYKKLNSNTTLGFYCIEDVTIVTNGVSKTYPANSNVEVSFTEGDVFEVIPTSDKSILSLTSFPGALGTFYPWLEGVKQFSNILFDMNDVDMYSKWSQGNQGAYQVQFAQYTNCIFWSDNPYISEVAKRTNYTLLYSSQLPLCYSTIPDNTFKAFYLAFGVNSDPNWGNKAYRDSFAKANWATQVFSYYGARTIGIFGHDDPDFNIILPPDCRGLMCEATAIENAGTFDAINVTNFGAKSGSWRDAFRMCYALRNLYIKNLKVNLNVSWSPLNYESIYFIISTAANTKKITISVSPYTYNLLSQSDFELATSKNIVIELLTANFVEDKRLSDIANKADKTYVDEIASRIPNEADLVTKKYLEDNFQSILMENLPIYNGEVETV